MSPTCMFDRHQASHMGRCSREQERRTINGLVVDWVCKAPALWVVNYDDDEAEDENRLQSEDKYYLCGHHAKVWNWIEPEFRGLMPERQGRLLGPRAVRIDSCQSSEVASTRGKAARQKAAQAKAGATQARRRSDRAGKRSR